MARSTASARWFLLGGGFTYLILWLAELIVDHYTAVHGIAVDATDTWLHLGLGTGMIAFGLATSVDEHHTSR